MVFFIYAFFIINYLKIILISCLFYLCSMDNKKQVQEIKAKIELATKKIYEDILKDNDPKIVLPSRALSNMTYDKKNGYLKQGKIVKERNLNLNTVKTFSQTMKLMAEILKLMNSNNSATKRELYYMAKAWKEAKFDEQTESDSLLSDIEGLLNTTIEHLGIYPEEKGGSVSGKLIIEDLNRATGEKLKIDCSKFGSGSYSIPSSIWNLTFKKTNAKFILAIETAGAFQRLNNSGFHTRHNCILVSMGGVPTRSCRAFIRKLSDEQNIPVIVFTDGDPYGYGNIYRTLKAGSANAGHLNEIFSVPKAKYVGVTASDIKDYDLPTTDLKPVDIKKINDLLSNDPFMNHYKAWQKELRLMLKLGQRVEQQAFALHSLDYVEEYLIEKIIKKKKFLP